MMTRDHRPRWTRLSGPYFVLFLSFGKLWWFLMVSNYVITITYCRHYNKIFPSCFQRWKVWALRGRPPLLHRVSVLIELCLSGRRDQTSLQSLSLSLSLSQYCAFIIIDCFIINCKVNRDRRKNYIQYITTQLHTEGLNIILKPNKWTMGMKWEMIINSHWL